MASMNENSIVVKLLLLFLLVLNVTAQVIEIESFYVILGLEEDSLGYRCVTLDTSLENDTLFEKTHRNQSPHIYPSYTALDSRYSATVDRLNKSTIQFAKNNIDIRWESYGYSYELHNDTLMMITEWQGLRDRNDDTVFIDLTTGDTLDIRPVDLGMFFSPKGLLDFSTRLWSWYMTPDSIPFEKRIHHDFTGNCSEIDGGVMAGDLFFNEVTFIGDSVSIIHPEHSHKETAVQFSSVTFPLEELRPYLNELGDSLLFKTDFRTMNPIEKARTRAELIEHTNHYFLGRGRFTSPPWASVVMVLDMKNCSSITGNAQYGDQRRFNFELRGSATERGLELTESINGAVTGYYLLNSECGESMWYNHDRTDSLSLIIDVDPFLFY